MKNNFRYILIRVDGSHSIGLGHIFRMKTLASALQGEGYDVEFLTIFDTVANKLLAGGGFFCHILDNDSYESVLHSIVRNRQPDLIIQDILTTPMMLMKNIRRILSCKIINFDDIGAGLSLADAVINSIVFHLGEYDRGSVSADLFEGLKYAIMQPEISRYMQKDKKIRKQAKNILLAFGGSDTHNVTERVLEAVNTVDSKLNIKINLGPGSVETDRLQHVINASEHCVDVTRFAPSLFSDCFNSDLVICGGGVMLYELAVMGVPSISIALEAHEVSNTSFWSEKGTTAAFGWEKTMDIAQLSNSVRYLLDDRQQRLNMSKAGKLVIDDKGVDRVLKLIGEYVK